MYVPRLSLKGNHKSFSLWKTVIEKIERRLSTWSSYYTSKGRRLTLIQATLSNLPTYGMSLFKMPQNVASNIERLLNYLSKDDPHLVGWNIVNLPIEKGGRTWSFLDKESSPHKMDMELSSRRKCLVEKSYKG